MICMGNTPVHAHASIDDHNLRSKSMCYWSPPTQSHKYMHVQWTLVLLMAATTEQVDNQPNRRCTSTLEPGASHGTLVIQATARAWTHRVRTC
mmetsp:Transcript_44628/g.80001  ORF Transcript_44628/g.80001 Transcript_44628/m.80001 type:complete len:93 (-) Transcript_44628:449-727(-)